MRKNQKLPYEIRKGSNAINPNPVETVKIPRITNDELLDTIERHQNSYMPEAKDVTAWDALKAVVELHKPIKDEWIEYTTCKACRVADDDYYSPVYPCFTIQAIEKELN